MTVVDFREAVQRLGTAYTRQEIADALDVSFHSVRQAALPSESPGHRAPPPGWRLKLAHLARERMGELDELRQQLEHDHDGRVGA